MILTTVECLLTHSQYPSYTILVEVEGEMPMQIISSLGYQHPHQLRLQPRSGVSPELGAQPNPEYNLTVIQSCPVGSYLRHRQRHPPLAR